MSDSVRARAGAARTFDGIICIGGSDWWYHNRGHFDLQIMRRIARQMPVLYVNSLGVRMPGLTHNGQFATRVSRKIKSLKRGLVNVENKFSVFSPMMVPGGIGLKISSWALAPQIRMAARRCGINKPLLWVHCPAGAPLIDELGAAALVFQRTDRFEAFPEADAKLVGQQITKLKAAADLVIYAAEHLQNEEAHEVPRSMLVSHGVDFDTFSLAGKSKPRDPIDMVTFPRPRVGFVGSIDAHTFDPELFLQVAAEVKEASFVMAGACSLPDGWCTLGNVKFLGRKPYEEVARIMAACDVLIMPWNDSAWIKACNPIKLKEYLAVGRPIVTRDFPALDGFRDLVRSADTAQDFAAAIREALATPYDAEPGRIRIAAQTWDSKTAAVQAAIEQLMREPRRQRAPTVAASIPSPMSRARAAPRPLTTLVPQAAALPGPLQAPPIPQRATQPPLRLRVRVTSKPRPRPLDMPLPGEAQRPDELALDRHPEPALEHTERHEPSAPTVGDTYDEPVGMASPTEQRPDDEADGSIRDHTAPPPEIRPPQPDAPKQQPQPALTPQQRKRQQLNAVLDAARESVGKKPWYQLGGGKAGKAAARAGERRRG